VRTFRNIADVEGPAENLVGMMAVRLVSDVWENP
jgi:hypothetical protein